MKLVFRKVKTDDRTIEGDHVARCSNRKDEQNCQKRAPDRLTRLRLATTEEVEHSLVSRHR